MSKNTKELRDACAAIDLQALGREIASHLDFWEALPPREDDERGGSVWIVRFKHKHISEAGFTLTRSTWPPELHVSANWPGENGSDRYQPREFPRPAFSPLKPAAQMAKDIERRLLVPYLLELPTQIAARDEWLRRVRAADELARTLSGILDPMRQPARLGNNSQFHIYGPSGVRVTVDKHGSCTFTINFDMDEHARAVGLARFLGPPAPTEAEKGEALDLTHEAALELNEFAS